MKVTNTSTQVRAAMSPAEIADLQSVIHAADRAGVSIPGRVSEIVAALSIAASDVRSRQRAKVAEKHYAAEAERQRLSRERQFMIGDRYSVMASRADYADISSDPDAHHWVDLILQEVLNKPIPAQCEIRRDVWCVRVVRLNANMLGDVVGSDCSQTSDVSEIRLVAESLIRRFETRERMAA